MKRLIIYFLIILFLAACFIPEVNSFSLSYFFTNGEFSLFSKEESIIKNDSWQQITKIGNEYMASKPLDINFTPFWNPKEIRGEMVVLPKTEIQINNLSFMKTKIGYENIITDSLFTLGKCQYGYSPLIPTFIVMNNKKINLQIVEKENTIIIGYPVILGSY